MKQVRSIDSITKKLSQVAIYYENISSECVMVVGSTALAIRGVPIIPNDIDIVISKTYYKEFQHFLNKINLSYPKSKDLDISITTLEEGLPFFSHSNKTLSWHICYKYSETITFRGGGICLLPPLSILLILGIKKLDDAFTLAKANYPTLEESERANNLLYRSLGALEKTLLTYPPNEYDLLFPTFEIMELNWYIPYIPRILLVLQEFCNMRNSSNTIYKRIKDLIKIIEDRKKFMVVPSIEDEIKETISNRNSKQLRIFNMPSGFFIKFHRSGNVYRTNNLKDVQKLAIDTGASIRKACTDIRIVHFQITNRCSLKCSHCMYRRGGYDLPMNQILELLKEFYEAGICEVDFGEGGEDTLRPDLARIIYYTSEKYKMTPNLTTNLTIPLSDELVETLSKYAGSVVISLDNYHHPAFAQYGIPVEVNENLKKLRFKGITPAINYVYEPDNFTKIIADIKWLYKEGFTKITLLRRFGNYNQKQTSPSNSVIDTLLDLLSGLDIEIGFVSCDPLLEHPLIYRAMTETGLPAGAKCKAGKEFVFVDIEGNVRPCGYCPSSKALRSSSFQESIIKLRSIFDADSVKDITYCPYKNIIERR